MVPSTLSPGIPIRCVPINTGQFSDCAANDLFQRYINPIEVYLGSTLSFCLHVPQMIIRMPSIACLTGPRQPMFSSRFTPSNIYHALGRNPSY